VKLIAILSTSAVTVLFSFACQAQETLRACNSQEHATYWIAVNDTKSEDPEVAAAASQKMDLIRSQCNLVDLKALQLQLSNRGY